MNIEKMICPNCNANLFIPNGNKYLDCPYCGATLHLDDGVKRTEYSKEYHYYDEAKINKQRMDENERIRKEYNENQRRQEREKYLRYISEKNKKTYIYSLLIGLILAVFLTIFVKLWGHIVLSDIILYYIFFFLAIYFIEIGICIHSNLKWIKVTIVAVGICILLISIGFCIEKRNIYEKEVEKTTYSELLDEDNTTRISKENVYWSGWLNDNYLIGDDGVNIEYLDEEIIIVMDVICIEDSQKEVEAILEPKRKFFCKWNYLNGSVSLNSLVSKIDINGSISEIKNQEETKKLLEMKPDDELTLKYFFPTSDVETAYGFISNSTELRVEIRLQYQMDDSNKTVLWIE